MNLLKPPPFHIFNHFSFSVEFWTPWNCPHLMSECHAQVCSPWIFPQPTWTQVLSFPYFSVTSQPVICNWLVNLNRSSCVNWAEILERPLEIIYYVKKKKPKSKLTAVNSHLMLERTLFNIKSFSCPLCFVVMSLHIFATPEEGKKHFLETS